MIPSTELRMITAGASEEVLGKFWARVEKGGPDALRHPSTSSGCDPSTSSGCEAQDDKCWEWTGSVTGSGTPVFFWVDRGHSATRIMWELARGECAPEGVQLRRTCRNNLCVNPAHLAIMDGSVLPGSLVEGSELARPSEGLVALFWAKVEKRGEDECWKWTGAASPTPTMKWGDKNASALKIMWELERGTAVPKGVQLRRTCGNLWCINPAHLKIWGSGGAVRQHGARPSIFLLADMAGCGLEHLGGGRYRVLRSPDWGLV